MLFNLGMTADAAAAHDSELASSHSETQLSMPSRHSSPRPFSLSNLPSWGKRSLSIREKRTEPERPERPRYEQRRSMPVTAIETISSSDDDQRSTAGPSPVRHSFSNQKYPKQPVTRPKTIYQLAHPATNARHKRLKLRPKLLLQLQQVSSTPRPVPVFDVLPSTLFMPRVARKVPAILRGKRGLGPNDLIVTTSDMYQGDTADKNLSSDEEGDHNEVVATICQPCKEDALAKGKAEICLNTGIVMEATPLPNGSYEFAAHTDSGLMIMRWVRRGPRKRRLSAPPGSIVPEDNRRFTFSVIDPTTRRHPVIASMAVNHLEIYDKYSLPSTAPSSPTSAMSVISDISEDFPLDQQVMETDEKLRLLITITSIWVAFREGWSHNFHYTDAAANGKGSRSTSVSKPVSTASGSENYTHSRRSSIDTQAADPNRRIVTWTASATQSPATDRSTGYGSLSKRSNSTGAAFMQRSNRRNSSTNRHSVLPTPRQSMDEPAELKPIQQNSVRRAWSQRKADDVKPDTNGVQSSVPHLKETSRAMNGQQDSSRQTKGKRRHRLSNLFDFITRKSGHHHE
ncbi:uncharacterized protein BDV14DRAFT_192939 [Aspergillus stella-maris]|uniref:uncharacterized protein n=1 Tax=Aspergillus stella-maris TaxID=1810926 RepID=UPI003CCCAA61